MARASIAVRSQHEADAVRLSLEHPALRTAAVITGLLLQIPHDDVRAAVLRLAQDAIAIGSTPYDDEPRVEPAPLRLHDGGGDTGE